MKVILQKDVANLGDAGDVKDVADGYARNYLIPKKIVIKFNESSKAAIEQQKHLIKVKKEKRKKISDSVSDKLKELSLVFKAKVGEDGKLFGAVTSIDIAKKLSEAGFEIDKRKIELEQPIRKIGEYTVSVKLDEGIISEVKVTVEQE
ncbi:MAG: 50S ribosomal protein L9 [Spirochaetes bacterium]|jgi:large subunit ribosomal protein L9|nr:50S ribosomal protein L9 [Spirochaetota bacterium]